MVLVISTGMAAHTPSLFRALGQGRHHVERVLDISTGTSIPTSIGTISGTLPLLSSHTVTEGWTRGPVHGFRVLMLFRRDSTERNVHVGSSTQATNDINPQLKVMDFPFSWKEAVLGGSELGPFPTTGPDGWRAAFLDSTTSISSCFRCAVCLSCGRSHQPEPRIDSSSTDCIAGGGAVVARHCRHIVTSPSLALRYLWAEVPGQRWGVIGGEVCEGTTPPSGHTSLKESGDPRQSQFERVQIRAERSDPLAHERVDGHPIGHVSLLDHALLRMYSIPGHAGGLPRESYSTKVQNKRDGFNSREEEPQPIVEHASAKPTEYEVSVVSATSTEFSQLSGFRSSCISPSFSGVDREFRFPSVRK